MERIRKAVICFFTKRDREWVKADAARAREISHAHAQCVWQIAFKWDRGQALIGVWPGLLIYMMVQHGGVIMIFIVDQKAKVAWRGRRRGMLGCRGSAPGNKSAVIFHHNIILSPFGSHAASLCLFGRTRQVSGICEGGQNKPQVPPSTTD